MTATVRTKAYQRYARRHGHYVSTVRTMTVLRLAALREYAATPQPAR